MPQTQLTEEVEEKLPIAQLMDRYQSDEQISLSTEEGVAEAEDLMNELIEYNQSDWVFKSTIDIMDLMKTDLASLDATNPELFQRLKRIVARGQWFTLDRFRPRIIEDLFRNYFEYFFEYTWEQVSNKTRIALLFVSSLEERDVVKKRLWEAFSNSPARISEESIELNGQQVEGTVVNWMKDFQLYLKDQEITPLRIVEYLGSSENIKRTSEETRKKVEGLLQYFEVLHRSSLTPEGVEETFLFQDPVSGTYKVLDRGEVQDTEVPIEKEDLEELRDRYYLDENGRQKSFTEVVKSSPLFLQGGGNRYEAPQISAEDAPIPEPTVMVPAADEEVERSAAPEEATYLEPIIPDEKLVPPAPHDQSIELPTMHVPEMKVPTPDVHEVDSQPPIPTPVKEQELDYNLVAKEVLNELKLLLPTLEMEKRFLSVLSSYFRGVRDNMEAAEALRQTEQEGGVDLPPEQIEMVMQTADAVLAEAKRDPLAFSASSSMQHEGGMQPTFAMVKELIKEQQDRDIVTGNEQPEEDVEDIFSNVNPIFNGNVTNIPVAPVVQPPKAKRLKTTQPPTAQAAPRIMSPIDELRSMDLTEFRRSADTPVEAAEKVMNTIDLLTEESLAKKADGMSAWKASALHKMYVDIGNRSLEAGKSVDEVIRDMAQTGNDTLTVEEFTAIADLNKKMRF